MINQNEISVASREQVEDIVFQLHQLGIDPESIGTVIVSIRRMWQWSPQMMQLLDRLDAQYVIPFTLGEPELPQRLLGAIEEGWISLNKAREAAGLPELPERTSYLIGLDLAAWKGDPIEEENE